MGRFGAVLAGALLALPLGVALAQPARNANVYNGQDHQPSGGGSVSGQAAQDLAAMNRPLQEKAQQSAHAPEVGANVYGTQPGGVVQITPTDGHAGSGVAK